MAMDISPSSKKLNFRRLSILKFKNITKGIVGYTPNFAQTCLFLHSLRNNLSHTLFACINGHIQCYY